jgi:CBS domain-containing protein
MNAGELCNRDVVVAYRDTSLVAAARLMREHHVGSLVVVGERLSDNLPVGMITDRDIVVATVAKEVDPRTLTVGDVMSAGALAGILAIDDVLELVAEQMDAFVQTLRSESAREARVRS